VWNLIRFSTSRRLLFFNNLTINKIEGQDNGTEDPN
jgi:hypothetical protein